MKSDNKEIRDNKNGQKAISRAPVPSVSVNPGNRDNKPGDKDKK